MERLSGERVSDPARAAQLEQAGYLKCRNPTCNWWISPEELSDMEGEGFFFSCPNCKLTYPLMDPTPFWINSGQIEGTPYENPEGYIPGVANRNYETLVGLTMRQQGQIAEQIVQELGEIPGYGPITWWSENYNDPIDGGAGEWAIEVKALCIDVRNHRFIPGPRYRKDQMIQRAKELGFKNGILGILVILDYRRSVADIYLKEMPFKKWRHPNGTMIEGPFAYRINQEEKFLGEIPFDNPFLNPKVEEPQAYGLVDESDIPF